MTKCITYRHGKAALIEDGLFGTRASNEGYPETREDFTITEKENVKALGTFNQEKVLEGAFSVIVETDCETDGSSAALFVWH